MKASCWCNKFLGPPCSEVAPLFIVPCGFCYVCPLSISEGARKSVFYSGHLRGTEYCVRDSTIIGSGTQTCDFFGNKFPQNLSQILVYLLLSVPCGVALFKDLFWTNFCKAYIHPSLIYSPLCTAHLSSP